MNIFYFHSSAGTAGGEYVLGERSRGTTIFGQHITENTTWTAANSPYFIEGDVYIDSGVNLTIESNVIIKFNGFYGMYVDGNLSAIGNEATPIEFTTNVSFKPEAGDWNTLKVNSTGKIILKYVKISYSNKSLFIEGASNNLIENVEVFEANMWGIWINKSNDNIIKNSKLHSNILGGLFLDSSLDNEIINCTFNDNDYDGVTADYSHDNLIDNCSFNKNTNDGLHLFYCNNIRLNNCEANDNKENGAIFATSSFAIISNLEVNNNNKNGMYVKESVLNRIKNCGFSGNDQGLYLYGSDEINIENSTFVQNKNNGIYFEDSSYNNIKYCTISSNDNTGIFLREEYIFNQGSYFNTITNCDIYGNTNGIYIRSSPGSTLSALEIIDNTNGLFFFESANSKIINSDIINNENNGIRIIRSAGINVTNCRIENNYLGISIGPDSTSNWVHHNDILNNTISAGDTNIGNYWDDDISEGNYWSDYNGTDMDHNGIGDEPYNISETAWDNYPLVDQYNIVLKVISTEPQDHAILVPLNTTVNITFSEQLKRESIVGSIIFTPDIEILSYNWANNDMKVILELPELKNGTTYFVTVQTSVTNISGKAMKFPHYFRFTTVDPFNTTYPTVLDHFPKGDNVSVNTTIEVIFSSAMHQPSVEQAFLIEPEIAVEVNWKDDRTVIFKPVKDLEILTNYTVIISTEAMNLIGNSLQDPYEFSFTTEYDHYPPYVIENYPTGDELVEVENVSIYIVFNEPVATDSVEERFEILPLAPGTFEWQDQNRKMYYKLQTALLYNVNYTIKLFPGVEDVYGNPTKDVFKFNFKTVNGSSLIDQPPYVIDRYPTGDELVPVETEYLFIVFNEPVNTSSVETRFKILPPTAGIFEWHNNLTILYYLFNSNLLYNITYIIIIIEGITDLDGNPTKDIFEFNFQTVPGISPFEVLEYSPIGYNVSVETEIYVIFNKYANQSSVESAVIINPYVNGNYSWSDTKLIFSPSSNLSYNTTYSIIITSTAKDTTGIGLDAPFSWQFTTHSGQPKEDEGDGEPGNGEPPLPDETEEPVSEDVDDIICLYICIVGIFVIIIFLTALVFLSSRKEEEVEVEEKEKVPRKRKIITPPPKPKKLPPKPVSKKRSKPRVPKKKALEKQKKAQKQVLPESKPKSKEKLRKKPTPSRPLKKKPEKERPRSPKPSKKKPKKAKPAKKKLKKAGKRSKKPVAKKKVVSGKRKG